jgi:AcrR family transcriptional regulator
VTSRGRDCRQRLLRATADLVAARGYHAVGVAEIGAAAGVTGAAIYRHFGTKKDLLVALMDQVVDDLLARAKAAAMTENPLESLIDSHVEFALRDRAIIGVYDQESHNLPSADLRRLRRKQRAYVDQWVAALRNVRPSQAAETALAQVHADLWPSELSVGLSKSYSRWPSFSVTDPHGEGSTVVLSGANRISLPIADARATNDE